MERYGGYQKAVRELDMNGNGTVSLLECPREGAVGRCTCSCGHFRVFTWGLGRFVRVP